MSATPSTATTSTVSGSRRRPPEVLTEPEAIALIKACSTRAPTGVRNRALIAVLWRSGLRISEALALELRDVDLEAGTLRVRHGKGNKSRTVGLDEQTAAMLARWIDRRRKLSPGARAPVFCTLAGGRVDASYVRHLLPRLAAKAGLDRRVHAHGLRHTYASELARERTPERRCSIGYLSGDRGSRRGPHGKGVVVDVCALAMTIGEGDGDRPSVPVGAMPRTAGAPVAGAALIGAIRPRLAKLPGGETLSSPLYDAARVTINVDDNPPSERVHEIPIDLVGDADCRRWTQGPARPARRPVDPDDRDCLRRLVCFDVGQRCDSR